MNQRAFEKKQLYKNCGRIIDGLKFNDVIKPEKLKAAEDCYRNKKAEATALEICRALKFPVTKIDSTTKDSFDKLSQYFVRMENSKANPKGRQNLPTYINVIRDRLSVSGQMEGCAI